MDFKAVISIIFQVSYAITILSLIVIIVLENRNPPKTIAWILVLTFLPLVGIVLYFLFGENHRRIRGLNKKLEIEPGSIEMLSAGIPDSTAPGSKYRRLSILLRKIDYAAVLGGNRIDFFSDGASKFEQLFTDIENAKEHVHLMYYKIADDRIGSRLGELLVRKAKEGVAVRVIYDDFGSMKTKKKFFRDLREAGVETEAYLPMRPLRALRRANYRNHRKIAVIDGRIGYVGGMNVADSYVEGVKWGTEGYWRDMQIRIEGQGVYGLQAVFLLDWYYTHKENLMTEPYFPPIEPLGGNPLQIVSGGPDDAHESIGSGFFEAMNSAQEYIYIQTPYFIPSDHIIKAMQTAAMSGIDVRIIIPGQSDSRFTDAVAFSYVQKLLRSDVKVYLYRAGFMHSKMFVIDGDLTIVGSANMDIRSFDLDFETCAFIYDRETASKAKEIFMNDLKDSQAVTLEGWNDRPWHRKAFESVMRLVAPLF